MQGEAQATDGRTMSAPILVVTRHAADGGDVNEDNSDLVILDPNDPDHAPPLGVIRVGRVSSKGRIRLVVIGARLKVYRSHPDLRARLAS